MHDFQSKLLRSGKKKKRKFLRNIDSDKRKGQSGLKLKSKFLNCFTVQLSFTFHQQKCYLFQNTFYFSAPGTQQGTGCKNFQTTKT